MPCNNCEEELITTSQGPQGEQGIQGLPGTNGTNGVLDWNEFNLSCWITEGIISDTEDNGVITQDFIDTVCEMYQRVNANPVAVNDYRTIDQGTTAYIQVIDNDIYYPDVTVTIAIAPSNGTATVEPDNKTIKYISNPTFVGIEDFDYTINDGVNTSTATIKVTVTAVISQQTIQDTVLTQLQFLLTSDDYWDLGFNIGDKIGISNINLVDFDFTNPFTAGIGKVGRYSKWAICNGNNGSEDLTDGTFRGFDHTNSDYDESAKTGGSDALSITLDITNIPAHRHTVDVPILDESFLSGYIPDGGGNTVIGGIVNNNQVSTTLPRSQDVYRFKQNSGDGTDNITNQSELPPSPAVITEDIRNTFKTVILIQKIIA